MTGPEIQIHFNSAGNFTVRLTVSDGTLSAVATTDIEVVFELPPERPHNNTTNGTPTSPGFLPGPEALAAAGAIATAALFLAVLGRRRR
jgi:hypothetical protein